MASLADVILITSSEISETSFSGIGDPRNTATDPPSHARHSPETNGGALVLRLEVGGAGSGTRTGVVRYPGRRVEGEGYGEVWAAVQVRQTRKEVPRLKENAHPPRTTLAP